MTGRMKRSPIKKMSEKKRKALGDRPVFSTIAPSGKGVKRVNTKRRKSEFARCFGSKEYVTWVRERPCVACGAVGYSECAHVGRFSGAGRRGSWCETVPLCGVRSGFIMGCHRVLHDLGRESFEKEYNINLASEAAKTQRAWLEHMEATK